MPPEGCGGEQGSYDAEISAIRPLIYHMTECIIKISKDHNVRDIYNVEENL